jgi:hypothetical protein
MTGPEKQGLGVDTVPMGTANGRDHKSVRRMRLRGNNDQPEKLLANCEIAKKKSFSTRSERNDGSIDQSKQFTLGCLIPKKFEGIPLTKT